MLGEKQAQRALGPQQEEQEVSHHRGGQDHGQGEHHIQHALDGPGEPGDVIGRKNAEEEHRRTADEGYAEAVEQRIPVHRAHNAVKPTLSKTSAAASVRR